MDNYIVEPLQHSEIEETASLLVDAFETNPAYSAIFKNKARVRDGLLWVFRTNLIINNYDQPLTKIIKEKETGEIIGTFTLVPPKGVKRNLSVYQKIGIPRFLAQFGLNTFVRMLRLDSINHKILNDSLKNSEYYYLSMVALKEEYRGRGIGSSALKYTLSELIKSNPDCRLMGLTTQLSENVTFYSRMGFETLDEGYITFKESKYYNYNMKLEFSKFTLN
ncbi:MAG TPA: N-acetyltransferase [Dysgonomonas sp.]|nr:N-acetyltransferase [Dysgonomonas sp.]